MAAPDVRALVGEVVGHGGDETVLEYVISVLELGDFEFGPDGEEAFNTFGEMLVGGGCLASEAQARTACSKLAAKLGSDTEAPPQQDSFRALTGGPVLMDDLNRVQVHASEAFNARDMIQTPFEEYNVGANLPKVSDKDLAKLKKRAEKDEKSARAALAAHQARAADATTGSAPTIIRNAGAGGSRDIHLENFSVSNGGQDLIEDATVILAFGRRYGLIGRNGTGKTTLLRALAAHGIKGIPDTCQVLHVEQEVVGDDKTVLQSVLECDTERTSLLQEEAELLARTGSAGTSTSGAASQEPASNGNSSHSAKASSQAAGKANGQPKEPASSKGDATAGKDGSREDAEAAARLTEVYKRLMEIDADGAEARAAVILAGLSFEPAMQSRATRTFSGGWRMRIALARALFCQPDLLLLDEPTNHLDLHAVLWLEDYLIKWPKTLLVVSHAREFLNAVCTDMLHLHSRKLVAYRGNYDTFEKTARERLRNAKKQAEALDAKKAHMQAFIDRFRYNANRAALVQSRIKALERLGDADTFEDDPEYVFRFPEPDTVAPPILAFTDVDFGYPGGPTLFRDLNFGLDMDSRFAIVGPNGIGKSTLLNLISGVLEPTRGQVTRNPKVRLATFSQHHVDGLDLALSPLAAMCRAFPLVKDQELRSHLGSFGISGDLALQAMYTLSGGQKSRVAFAKVTWTKPHILLLDEPSNHLDIDAVDALVKGLALFKGGVLMVSHDQHLIEATVDELWCVEDRTVRPYHGTFQDYKTRLRDLQRARA